MSLALIGIVALVAWLWFTGKLSSANLNRLIAGGIGLLALRLGFEGSPLGGLALGAVAALLFWETERRSGPSPVDLARARAVLGVDAEAGPQAIRAAYLARAAIAHPDRGGSVADMQALNAARDLLLRGVRGSAKPA